MELNKQVIKTQMRELDPNIRNSNFEEVALGYNLEEAINEAKRCLECKHKPCVTACPVNIDIPAFISQIKEGKINEAYEIILNDNDLGAICGRVCPQEEQCEGKCVRALKGESVGIGRLERFVSDNNTFNSKKEIIKLNKKIAVVGSGPAGISCAANLAKLGYEVTIFEALHEVGGVLSYGIPEFRLPNHVIKKEFNRIIELGVKIETNVVVGKSISLKDISELGYEAIFLGTGAGLPNFMGILGENFNGVFSANEFLTRVNLMRAYEFPKSVTPVRIGDNVAIIGGGNVAMDAARTAKRIGAKNVYIIYRRSMDELPARKEEIHHAVEEGIIFKVLTNPTAILGENYQVKGLKCIEMELGEKDSSGRRKPVPKPDSEFDIPMDSVIMAIGTSPNRLLTEDNPDLILSKYGTIIVDENTMSTSLPMVYAGGDVVSGAATVILAMGAGKKAAQSIHSYLSSKEE